MTTFGLSILAAADFGLQAPIMGVAREATPSPRISLRDSSFFDTCTPCVVLYGYRRLGSMRYCFGKYRRDFARLSTSSVRGG